VYARDLDTYEYSKGLLCCLGSFGTIGDMEFTTVNILLQIGKNSTRLLQRSVRSKGVVQ